MTASDPASAVEWLIEGARSASTPAMVLEQLCEKLVAEGLPLWRVAVFVRTLHPDVTGRRFLWQPGGPAEVEALSHAGQETDAYRLSPVVHVYATGVPLRRRLFDPSQPLDYSILKELRDQGATDYFGAPLRFSNGEIHMVSWTTRQPGGFSDAEIRALDRVGAPLARIAEIWALRRIATTLLDTYVGRHAGERILEGHIRRGDTESIHAAIWLSDMRGFTSLSDRLPPEEMIGLLNRYFDFQVPAIVEHGGEVLKFIGDGLLAIFPIPSDDTASATCLRALDAAHQARRAIARLTGTAVGPVQFGLALHLGRVLYGNIGGGNRLDFTCIGPAVNLAARIEKLTAELQRPILASAEFARHCAHAFRAVGEFELRGIGVAQTVFAVSGPCEL